MPKKKKRYKILSLDGGGIRGLYTAVLLERLEHACPGFLGRINLLAGTSTGGIIALSLAKGLAASELVSLYRDKGDEIFDDSFWDDLKDIGGLAGADYSNRNLKKILNDIFGKIKLSELKKRVLIPAFDLDNRGEYGEVRQWKPKFFHNFPGKESDGEELALDCAMRTSAAPTYFPSYGRYIDGGVAANNPSMAALAQALDDETGGQELSAVSLLSIGTGFNPQYLARENMDWGYGQWVKPLIQLMLDGLMGVADYECSRLLESHYHRLSPLLPEVIQMDETEKIPKLIEYAQAVDISKTADWIRREFQAGK